MGQPNKNIAFELKRDDPDAHGAEQMNLPGLSFDNLTLEDWWRCLNKTIR